MAGSLITLARARRGLASRVELLSIRTGQEHIDHAAARRILTVELRDANIEPTLPVLQGVQGVGWYEANYGRGWRIAGIGSNNWGAIQGGILSGDCNPNTPPPICDPGPSGGFLHGDSIPQDDGSSLAFECCYRRYPSPEAGARDLVKKVYVDRPEVLAAARRGDLAGFSAAMYDSGYYGGFGATREERILGHMRKMREAIGHITEALDEPTALSNEPLEQAVSAEKRAKAGASMALGAVVGLGALGAIVAASR